MALDPSRLCQFHMILAACCALVLFNVDIVRRGTLKSPGNCARNKQHNWASFQNTSPRKCVQS